MSYRFLLGGVEPDLNGCIQYLLGPQAVLLVNLPRSHPIVLGVLRHQLLICGLPFSSFRFLFFAKSLEWTYLKYVPHGLIKTVKINI